MNVILRAPAPYPSAVKGGGASYSVGADGSVSVDSSLVGALLNAGYRYYDLETETQSWLAPAAPDLVSIKAAALPANGAATIAAQPDYPRKLQVRQVDDGTHHITAGQLVLVGTDINGVAVTETISLITAVSVTHKTTYAYGHLTSATVSGLAGNGGTNTLGIGVANDLQIQTPPGFQNLAVTKEWANGADETVGTVDAVVGSIALTTAPDGTKNFEIWYQFDQAE